MDYQQAIETIQYASAFNSENSHLTKALDVSVSAMQELQMYKDAKLCLIPEDVFSKQCEEVDAYREIGTLEEVKDAMERQQAKKPNNVEAEGYRYTKTYRCPTCGGNFSGTGIANYCYHCGQKLDWGGCKDEIN